MKKLGLILTILAIPAIVYAANVKRLFQDVKLPSQFVLEHQSWTTPVLADADRLKNDQAGSDSVTTTVTSFLAQPDVCRNITVTTGGTTADVDDGDVVVTGKNVFGQTITESLALTENQNGATAGVKAFCSVSSVVFGVQDGAGAIFDIGVGDVLGLHRCMANAGSGIWAIFDGAYESTRGTWVADADEVEKNTYDPNGTLDGAKTVHAYFLQNYACYP